MNKKNIKCPKCKGKEFKDTNVSKIDHHVCEYDIICAKCGMLKERYLYGQLVVENFIDMQQPPFNYRFKEWIKKVFKRKSKVKTKPVDFNADYDDLPF